MRRLTLEPLKVYSDDPFPAFRSKIFDQNLPYSMSSTVRHGDYVSQGQTRYSAYVKMAPASGDDNGAWDSKYLRYNPIAQGMPNTRREIIQFAGGLFIICDSDIVFTTDIVISQDSKVYKKSFYAQVSTDTEEYAIIPYPMAREYYASECKSKPIPEWILGDQNETQCFQIISDNCYDAPDHIKYETSYYCVYFRDANRDTDLAIDGEDTPSKMYAWRKLGIKLNQSQGRDDPQIFRNQAFMNYINVTEKSEMVYYVRRSEGVSTDVEETDKVYSNMTADRRYVHIENDTVYGGDSKEYDGIFVGGWCDYVTGLEPITIPAYYVQNEYAKTKEQPGYETLGKESWELIGHSGSYPDWDSELYYRFGDVVSNDGNDYSRKEKIYTEDPGTSNDNSWRRYVFEDADGWTPNDSVDYTLVPIAVIDDYSLLSWKEKFNEYGTFELEIPNPGKYVSLLKEDMILIMKGTKKAMIVEYIERKYDKHYKIILSGRSLESILDRRVVFPEQSLTGVSFSRFSGGLNAGVKMMIDNFIVKPEDYRFSGNSRTEIGDDDVYEQTVVFPGRKIPFVSYSQPEDREISGMSISKVYKDKDLYESIKEICDEYGIGFKIELNNDWVKHLDMQFQLYYGKDYSIYSKENAPVILKPGINITSANHKIDTTTEKTFAVAYEEKDGKPYVDLSDNAAIFDSSAEFSFSNFSKTIIPTIINLLINIPAIERIFSTFMFSCVHGAMDDRDGKKYISMDDDDPVLTKITVINAAKSPVYTYSNEYSFAIKKGSDPQYNNNEIGKIFAGMCQTTAIPWLSMDVFNKAISDLLTNIGSAGEMIKTTLQSVLGSVVTTNSTTRYLCGYYDRGEVGWNRKETKIDGKDDSGEWTEASASSWAGGNNSIKLTSSKEDEDDDTVIMRLQKAARNNLNKNETKHTISCSPQMDNFDYGGKDKLGNIYEYQDEFGDMFECRLKEVEYKYTASEYKIIPTFDFHDILPKAYTRVSSLTVRNYRTRDIQYNKRISDPEYFVSERIGGKYTGDVGQKIPFHWTEIEAEMTVDTINVSSGENGEKIETKAFGPAFGTTTVEYIEIDGEKTPVYQAQNYFEYIDISTGRTYVRHKNRPVYFPSSGTGPNNANKHNLINYGYGADIPDYQLVRVSYNKPILSGSAIRTCFEIKTASGNPIYNNAISYKCGDRSGNYSDINEFPTIYGENENSYIGIGGIWNTNENSFYSGASIAQDTFGEIKFYQYKAEMKCIYRPISGGDIYAAYTDDWRKYPGGYAEGCVVIDPTDPEYDGTFHSAAYIALDYSEADEYAPHEGYSSWHKIPEYDEYDASDYRIGDIILFNAFDSTYRPTLSWIFARATVDSPASPPYYPDSADFNDEEWVLVDFQKNPFIGVAGNCYSTDVEFNSKELVGDYIPVVCDYSENDEDDTLKYGFYDIVTKGFITGGINDDANYIANGTARYAVTSVESANHIIIDKQ